MSNPPRLALCLLVVVVSAASATDDGLYPDRTVFSPNGKFRLEAKSPDNANDERDRIVFAGNFKYRLFDQASGRELWAHNQAAEDGPPMAIHVGNDRWVVVCGARQDIQVLDRHTRSRVLTFQLMARFPAQERRKYVIETNHGPIWANGSAWRFANVNGTTLFVIRAWWGRRVVIDVAGRRVVPDKGVLRTTLDRADRQFATATLRSAAEAEPPHTNTEFGEIASELYAAALLAGRMKIKETVPFLRKLETWEVADSLTVGGWRPEGWPQGAVNPLDFADFGLRQMVQLALRRLGERPACYAATRFRYQHQGGGSGDVVRVKSTFTNREQGRERLAAGMTPDSVLKLVGAPDLVTQRRTKQPQPSFRDYWEYDFDTDAPYTLRLSWTEDGRVDRVEIIRPPVWRDGKTRDRDIVY